MLKSILRCIAFAAIPALLFYMTSIAVMYSGGFSIIEILRDPAQQSGQSSFLGFLSNIGIWVWISSTAICFFAATRSDFGLKPKHAELLVLIGALSILLAVDDFFMIHDRYVNQNICYLTYALLAGAIMARHFSRIIQIDPFAFLLAGACLALSIMTDLIQSYLPISYSFSQIIEEGFKFGGATIWLYFCSRMTSHSLAPNTILDEKESG